MSKCRVSESIAELMGLHIPSRSALRKEANAPRRYGSTSDDELAAHFQRRIREGPRNALREFYISDNGRDTAYLYKRNSQGSDVVVTDPVERDSILAEHRYLKIELEQAEAAGLRLK